MSLVMIKRKLDDISETMKDDKIVKELLDWLLHIALALAFTFIIINYVGQFTVVQGNSMLPTLKPNSVLVIEKLTRRFGSLKQGNIIVVRIPELLGDGKTYAVKRIIATGGQKVVIKEGKVYVDGMELSEDYINGAGTFSAKGMYDDITVPDDCIYILGDNRYPGASKDSRIFGPINCDRVEGRVIFRLFPFSELGRISTKNLLSNILKP